MFIFIAMIIGGIVGYGASHGSILWAIIGLVGGLIAGTLIYIAFVLFGRLILMGIGAFIGGAIGWSSWGWLGLFLGGFIGLVIGASIYHTATEGYDPGPSFSGGSSSSSGNYGCPDPRIPAAWHHHHPPRH